MDLILGIIPTLDGTMSEGEEEEKEEEEEEAAAAALGGGRGVAKRVVAAAQRIFGMGGESRLKLAAKKGTCAKLLRNMFALAVQREYEEELSSEQERDRQRLYLAHKPEFGRAQWI